MKRIVRRMICFDDLKPIHWIFICSIFIAFHLPAIWNDNGQNNAYTYLAESMIRGKLSLSPADMPNVRNTDIRNTGDLIFNKGQYYLPYPPAPAILMLPFVLMGAGWINCTLIAVLLSCLNIFLFYKILKKIKADNADIPWLIYGFFFGTCYWFVLFTSHHVYGFAEVVSVTGLFLLLNELLGKQRAILMGLFVGVSFLSRQFSVFITLFVAGYLIYDRMIIPSKAHKRIFWRKLGLFSATVCVSIFIYLLYNYARFGNILDTGYSHIVFIGTLKYRVETYGLFSPHYVLYNLYSTLLKGFNIQFIGSGNMQIKDVDLRGTALLFASPFIVFAFKTHWNKFLRIFAWLSIGVIFTGLLFYHNNGMEQVNASRFTLDFLPLLMILVALGAKHAPKWLFKSMIIYAILLNIIAFAIHFLFHTLGVKW